MTDIVMITKVIHPTKFENSPLVLSLSIFLSLPIFRIIKIIGIAMIPLITEAYMNYVSVWNGIQRSVNAKYTHFREIDTGTN